ncbi:MAG: nucleoside diphosphate kinase regulator [Anaerolineae bacterium]|nr:nucleoside diphosphate kinase regulator [Anaerolineae bacterium]
MKNRDIYITDQDIERLNGLLETARRFNYHNRAELAELEAELARGHIMASAQVPPDVITMNSTVCLVDLETGEEMVYTLVFPNEADIEQNRISILAPIGTALLGYKVGDTVEWQVPGGLSRLSVKGILYQPEASGTVETEVIDFSPSGQAMWRDMLEKVTKNQEVFDDYSFS